MAVRLVERSIRVEAGVARQEHVVQMPQGAVVRGILPEGDVLIAADPQLPDEPRYFSVVLGSEAPGGVLLTAREVAGIYLGSFRSYVRQPGGRVDRYHVFEVPAP